MNEIEAANRVIHFLLSCGYADIEAGVGKIMGGGSADEIFAFQQSLADAIKVQEF